MPKYQFMEFRILGYGNEQSDTQPIASVKKYIEGLEEKYKPLVPSNCEYYIGCTYRNALVIFHGVITGNNFRIATELRSTITDPEVIALAEDSLHVYNMDSVAQDFDKDMKDLIDRAEQSQELADLIWT
jgi:hypothetical protein